MPNKACSCWAANMDCLLLVLLVMHASIQCTTADPADSGREDANRRAQSTNQNNINVITENAVAGQSNGQSKETEGQKSKETENQKSQSTTNAVLGATQSSTEAGTKNNGATKATTAGSTNTNGKKPDKVPKEVELKVACNKTTDCALYNDTACVPDGDGQNRCLCGNRTPPRNSSFCKNIRRYVKFPCKVDTECIADAVCKLVLTNNTKPHVAHTSEPTAYLCWCKEGLNYTEDNSQCLDALGLLRVEQGGRIAMLQSKLDSMEEFQDDVKTRLHKLESSAQDFLPSLTITVLMAASMLVVH